MTLNSALAAMVAAAALFSPPAARRVQLGTPVTIADVDLGKLKGDFTRLAWSTDGSEFYIQTIERDRGGAPKAVHHYIVSAAKSVKSVEQEPSWASQYWMWKSSQSSPANRTFRINVHERTETKRAVSAPTGGVLARGGTADPGAGTTLGDVAAAADATQAVKIFSLDVKGETIGEWANEAVVPGVNYSWAPAPLPFIAYAKRDGGPLVLMDDTGGRQELTGAHSAILPAWSDDGKRIAWLERKDRKKYQLTIADVAIE
jgi:hypothetical protein